MTGGGVDRDTNQRMNLVTLMVEWEKSGQNGTLWNALIRCEGNRMECQR